LLGTYWVIYGVFAIVREFTRSLGSKTNKVCLFVIYNCHCWVAICINGEHELQPLSISFYLLFTLCCHISIVLIRFNKDKYNNDGAISRMADDCI